MSAGNLETIDFDRWMSLSEKAHRDSVLASNDAFIAAMTKAVRKGRESARQGTFIDTSPTLARTFRGDVIMSSCGSPAAMCAETGGAGIGASTLK
jgi:hypothetical protein